MEATVEIDPTALLEYHLKLYGLRVPGSAVKRTWIAVFSPRATIIRALAHYGYATGQYEIRDGSNRCYVRFHRYYHHEQS